MSKAVAAHQERANQAAAARKERADKAAAQEIEYQEFLEFKAAAALVNSQQVPARGFPVMEKKNYMRPQVAQIVQKIERDDSYGPTKSLNEILDEFRSKLDNLYLTDKDAELKKYRVLSAIFGEIKELVDQ